MIKIGDKVELTHGYLYACVDKGTVGRVQRIDSDGSVTIRVQPRHLKLKTPNNPFLAECDGSYLLSFFSDDLEPCEEGRR